MTDVYAMCIPEIVKAGARWLAVRIAEKRQVHGVTLVDLARETPDGQAAEGAAKALELIHQHDPAVWRRLVRDVRYVVVTKTFGTAGEYWVDSGWVLLNEAVVMRQMTEFIAMVVVHEATHARLWRMGFGRCPDRERIETACVEAEIRFARRLPGTANLIAGARAKLTRYWETDLRGNARKAERRERKGAKKRS